MTDLNTADYYRNRLRQELALADRASDRSIADIHREMAERYRIIVARLDDDSRQPAVERLRPTMRIAR